ncbi:hypothetical protein D3C86_1977570 [compost metagenome]
MGKSQKGRSVFVEQGITTLSIVKDGWKYITPNGGTPYMKAVGIETGNLSTAQLYNLNTDLGEKSNLADKNPTKVKELAGLLESIKSGKK